MSKSKSLQQDINESNAEHRENSKKVRDAGISIGKTSGMGQDNYYFYEGVAYDSHQEAVKDIVQRKNL